MRRLPQSIRVAGTYLFVAALWILFSDQLVGLLITDPQLVTLASTLKGWAFVAVTTALLFAALERDRREVAKQEVATSEAEQRFSRIVETVPDAILLLDTSGGVTYMNAAAERLLGWSWLPGSPAATDFGGVRSAGGLPLPPQRNPIERALADGGAIRSEVIALPGPQGSRIVVVVNVAPIAGETSSGLLVSLTDITAEHQASERVQLLSRLYQVLAETSQAVQALAEGHDIFEEACRIAVDVAGLRMAWVGTLELTSRRIVPVAWAGHEAGYLERLDISADDVPAGRGPSGRAVREGVTVVSNDIANDPAMVPWREQALQRGYYSSAALPLRLDGEIVGVFVVYGADAGFFDSDAVALLERIAGAMSFGLEFQRRDEDRRTAFEQLEQYRAELEVRVDERTAQLSLANERLAQADTAKSQFLANMSHELRTPLNSIIGFTGIILQGIAGELTDEQRKQLEMVYRSGKSLLSLVNDVLDLSRIEAGRVRMEPEEFDAVEAVAGVVASMRLLVEQKGLVLEEALPDAPLAVLADRGKVQQVLTNLLSNAVKFTTHGSLSVTLAAMPAGRRFKIAVSDTGPGIPDAELEHVFDEFYQVPRPEGDKSQGSGLGLTITKQLVHMMGGELLVRSEVGVGSVFEVVLPLRLPQATPDATDVLPDDALLVLAVDDDPSSLALISRWLARAGMRVIESADAAEAISLVGERAIDVLVLDIMLPGMSGQEALQRLRSDPRVADVPIVCISSNDPSSYGEPRLADACLVKPLAEVPFIAAVRGAVKSKVGHNRGKHVG
ncbi:MAG: ATP-binding protein [Coriobacteriia bacterium]|nr:ATP-binding protein [Coriobacteriia bacterium]